MLNKNKQKIRHSVFWPSLIVVGGAAAIGLLNNELLSEIAKNYFSFSLDSFGWLYQVVSIITLIFAVLVTFSKVGNVRFGGKDAKPKFSFMKWFAMALTGGIATGIVTYGVNEPIIYLGNIYGELNTIGITPKTSSAALFSIARCFYNWTFIPYAMYSLSGLVIAYVYFNKKESLSVTSSLVPLFGNRIKNDTSKGIIDTLAVLAIALGLASSLGAGLTLVGSGIETTYGIKQGPILWLALTLIIAGTFIGSSILGLEKGIQKLSDFNAKIYYVLLLAVILVGPAIYILRLSTTGMGHWLQNFWGWSLDAGEVGGSALVKWWTLYDWAIWIAYAPLMGIFLAIISYGRTIKQFMIINWIMPSIFSIIWFGAWGSTAIHWQMEGKLDLVKTITEYGAVSGLWKFLDYMPLGFIFIPILMITLVLSFSTAADSMTRTISTVCSKDLKFDEEPPKTQKILWGVLIATIAFVMVAFSGGSQGVDGVKYLAAAGGSFVLFLFTLQLVSGIKMFFYDDLIH